MTRNRLTGRHVQSLLGVYVLGGLRGRQEARVRAHLSRCGKCRAEYRKLAELPALLDMITDEEAAEGLPGQHDAGHSRAGRRRPGPQGNRRDDASHPDC